MNSFFIFLSTPKCFVNLFILPEVFKGFIKRVQVLKTPERWDYFCQIDCDLSYDSIPENGSKNRELQRSLEAFQELYLVLKKNDYINLPISDEEGTP